MKWEYYTLGIHTHVHVYMNGALCGKLCFRKDEFIKVKENMTVFVTFVDIN